MGFNPLTDMPSPEKTASVYPYSAKSLQTVQLTLFGICLARHGKDFPFQVMIN